MRKLLLLSAVTLVAISYSAFAKSDGHDHEAEEKHSVSEASEKKHEEHDNNKEEDKKDDGHGHAEGGDEHEEKTPEVDLSLDSMKKAGIVVETLMLQNLEGEITSPGEVTLNTYLSSKVTTRVPAVVIRRHAKLGDVVKKGQRLVTLSSVDVAEAVGDALIAYKEWQRVSQLGSNAVSAKRYSEAKIANKQATAKVVAYGISKGQLALHKKGKGGNPGEFQLTASKQGTIISDSFIEGELIEPGRVLFDIANEDMLWVESRLSPDVAKTVELGTNARIHVPSNGWLQGKVIQKHHLLDKETRTIGVRIEVNNEKDLMHPGMYVDTKIQTGGGQKYLAVPSSSVLRSPDGDWVIFVESEDKKGEFKPQEIETIRTVDEFTIIEGVLEGTKVVTKGAFFVQSELAKSGFSVHNH